MKSSEAERQFRWGLSELSRRNFAAATSRFRRAILAEREAGAGLPSANYISYYSLSRALAHGPTHEDVRVCRHAVVRNRFDARLWRNLAEVCQLAGKRTRALEAIEQGLKLDPNDPKLRSMLSRADRRGRPVFPSLGRDNPINRSLGRLRARWPRRAGVG
jgi:predicted Zn-dependent protease